MASQGKNSNPTVTKVEIVLIGREWTEETILHLAKDLENARISKAGTALHPDQFTQSNIGYHAGGLAASLVSDLPTTDRPIVFVTESLDGLICAQLILGDRRSDDIKRIAERTRGILSLAAPFSGSFIAEPTAFRGERISIVMEPASIFSLAAKGNGAYEKALAALHKIIADIFEEKNGDTGTVSFQNYESQIANQARAVSIQSQTLTWDRKKGI